MINEKYILEHVSSKGLDNLDEIVDLLYHSKDNRDKTVVFLLNHPHINIYFSCFQILERATSLYPMLFYEYFEAFSSLLDYKNTYHKDAGISLIGNLCSVDKDNLFKKIANKYFMMIKDEKSQIALYSIQYSKKVIQHKPEYLDFVTNLYLNIKQYTSFSEKRLETLKYDILCFLESVYYISSSKKEIMDYINNCTNSPSPKTRKKAKELIYKL